MIADILLICGAAGAAAYCMILSRRLRGLMDPAGGMGQAIATLTARSEEINRAITEARTAARTAAAALESATTRAEAAERRLQILMASLHDLPEPAAAPSRRAPPQAPEAASRPASARLSAAEIGRGLRREVR